MVCCPGLVFFRARLVDNLIFLLLFGYVLFLFCACFVPEIFYMPRHLMVLYGKMRFRAVFAIFVSESDAASSGVQVPGGIDA